MAKKTSRSLAKDYLRLACDLLDDTAGVETASRYLKSVYEHGNKAPVTWGNTPYLIDAQQQAVLEECASTMGAIMDKVMARYHRDRNFRKLFGLSPEVEQLTLVPSGCHAAVPLSRIDMLYDVKTHDYKIMAIVTGAVSGMAESVEVSRALLQMPASRAFAEKYQLSTYDPVNEVVLTLLHTYGKWANAQEGRNHPTNPSLAVVDVAGSPRLAESEYVIERLREQGCYCHTTEVSELRIETIAGVRQLVDNHGPVTCVWMRPTAEEAIANMDNGVRTLLEATRRGLVCTIGGYRSWPCSTKAFLEVLRTRECRAVLSREENAFVEAHVDETHVVNAYTDISRFYDQQNWMVRLADGPAERTVLAGSDMNRYAWRNLLVKSIKANNAVQRAVPVQTIAILGDKHADGTCETKEITTLLGLYVFEGSMGGVRAIGGTGNTTASWNDRMALGCIKVDKR